MKKGVIILSHSNSKLGSPTDIGVIRCLKKENIPIILLTSKNNDPALFSSHIHSYLTPVPEDFPNLYLRNLNAIGRKYPGYVLMPTSDSTLKFVSDNRNLICEELILPLPSKDVVDICLKKTKTYEYAAKYNIPIPNTFIFNDIKELINGSKDIKYPCIIKPTINKDRKYYFKKVIQIESSAELISICKKLYNLGSVPFIQEIIVGPPTNLYSLGVVFNYCNDPIAIFTGRKKRQISYDFGVGTYCESIWVPEIAEIGTRFLKSIDFVGIAQIEFKYDLQDQRYKLLEINARPWFWVSLTAACGMNLPYLLYKMATGDDEHFSGFRQDVKWQWFVGDIGLLMTQIISKHPDFSFKSCIPDFFYKRVFATYSKSDLVPFIKEIQISLFKFNSIMKYVV